MMRGRVLAVLASLVLLLVGCAGATSATKAPGLAERVIEHKLANGLAVLLVERHQAPVVSINVTFGVGGINEMTGATGVAHLYEHMAFKGTRTIGTKDYARERPLLDELDRLNTRIEARRAAGADTQELQQLRQVFKDTQDRADQLVVGNEMSLLYQRHGAVGLNASTGKDVTRYVISMPANRLPLWAAIESDRMANPVLREFYK